MAIIDELMYRVGFEVDKTSFGNVSSSLKSLIGISAKITGVLSGVQAAISGASALFVGAAAKIEDAEAAFTPLLGGVDKAKVAVKELNKLGAETPFEFGDLASQMKQLLPVMNGDINKTTDTMRMLGDTAGGNAQKLETITRGYTKAMLKGKVDMESLNMISEAGVPIFDQLSKSMGVSTNELFKMISSGDVATDKLTDVFRIMTKEGGLFYNGMIIASQTFNGRMSTLTDNVNMAAAAIGTALLPRAKQFVDKLIDVAGKVQVWAEANKDVINSGLDKFLDILKKAFYATAAAVALFAIYQLGLAAMAIPSLISAFVGLIARISLYNVIVGIANAITWLWNAGIAFIPLLIGLAIVALALLAQDVYKFFTGGPSLIGVFLDKLREMFPIIDSIGTYWKGVWNEFMVLIDRAIAKLGELKAKALDNPLAKGLIAGYNFVTGNASPAQNAPAGNGKGMMAPSNTEVKINVNGVNNPMDAANMVMGAIKQETMIGKQNYGVGAR